MFTTRVWVAAFACGCSAALANPPITSKAPPVYFPVTEGTKLEYETTAADGRPRGTTEIVTKVEAVGGTYLVTIERPPVAEPGVKMPARRRVFLVSARGVTQVAGSEGTPDPLPVLMLPAGAGDQWAAKQGGFARTFTAGAAEQVEVPAGTFKAIPVTGEYETPLPGGGRATLRETTWYAAGVGEVKRVGRRSPGQETTTVLKSVTPGR